MNRHDELKKSMDEFNANIMAIENDISRMISRLLSIGGFKNKKVVSNGRIVGKYHNNRQESSLKISDVQFSAFISHDDIKLVNRKEDYHESFTKIIKFLKSIFDLHPRDYTHFKIYEAALMSETGVDVFLQDIMEKLYDLSEMDDDSLELLIKMKN